MAGKRQHYIPRLLQRGFLAGPADGAERTWLHRAGTPARFVGIRDVGVEEWFYSRIGSHGELTLDDAITEFERDLGKDVAVLRKAALGTEIDPTLAARTVVHLVMRTAHLRRVISAGVASISDELRELFTSADRLGAMFGLNGPGLAATVVDSIRSSAQDLVPAGVPVPLSERLMWFFVREFGDQLVSEAIGTLAPLIPNLFDDLAGKIRDTHNAVLQRPSDESGWFAALSTFSWSVEAATDLILPDAVALARESGGEFAPFLFTKCVDAEIVLLPLSHDRMLTGRSDKVALPDLAGFNVRAAASCDGFFIAARPFDAEMLNANIGIGPARALGEAISEAVREFESARSGTSGIPLHVKSREQNRQEFTFQVVLNGFGDADSAQKFAEVLRTVIEALSQEVPLHDLDGITIAADYQTALAELDRGDPDLLPVTSSALEYGFGVAMPVTVVRDGRNRTHLVFAAGIANGWLSENPATKALSVHLLIKMLSGIAHATLYADAPGFTPDVMARHLHYIVAPSIGTYWCAKEAAFVAPDQGGIYADLLIDSLEYTRNGIETERSRMFDDSDIGNTFTTALRCISAILTHAADWLGHRDGLADGLKFEGSDLTERLIGYGLEHWIVLFGRDLAACYTDNGALDYSYVETLSRHVERLLWCFGIYCWPEGEEVRCVVSNLPIRPSF